jgi:hypothetical protein
MCLALLAVAVVAWIESDINDACGSDVRCHVQMEAPQ